MGEVRKVGKRRKAFWISLGVFVFTIFIWGLCMYIGGISNPFKDSGGVLGYVIRIDRVFSLFSGISTIVTALFQKYFK